MKKVTIHHNNPSDFLFESLNKNPRLKEITFVKEGMHVVNNRFTHNIANFVETNTTVEKLEMKHFNFYETSGARDLKDISEAVSKNTTLKSFSLNDCSAGEDLNVIPTFTAALKNNHNLTHVGFNTFNLSSEFGKKNLRAITNLVSNNSTLTSIDFGNSFIQDPEDFKALAAVLENNKTLQNLKLTPIPRVSSEETFVEFEKIEALLERNQELAKGRPNTTTLPFNSSRPAKPANEKGTDLTTPR